MLKKLEELKRKIEAMSPEELKELFEKHKVDPETAKQYAFLERMILEDSDAD